MAIPRLADMAALTLFHNPHMQPEDVSVPFGEGYSEPATRIQRRQRLRSRAASKISAVLKGFLTRFDYLLRYAPRIEEPSIFNRRVFFCSMDYLDT